MEDWMLFPEPHSSIFRGRVGHDIPTHALLARKPGEASFGLSSPLPPMAFWPLSKSCTDCDASTWNHCM